MKIYIVSCSPGRVERLLKAAEPLHLDFEVVESPLSSDEEVQRRGRTCFKHKKAYPAGLAATIGHIRAMDRIAKRDDHYAIIIEDDVRFHKQFNEYMKIIEEYMTQDKCDVFSIGFLSVIRKEKVSNFKGLELIENVGISNPWGAQCYVVTKNYAIYFSKRFSGDDLYLNYQGDFVTDFVIFDPIINCRRSTLIKPIVVESPYEQSIVGSCNKPPLSRIGVDIRDFTQTLDEEQCA